MVHHQINVYSEDKALREADPPTSLPDYDINRPWNTVFKRVLSDSVWWGEEVREPCLLLLARLSSLSSLVEGDAPVAGRAAPPGTRDHPGPKRPAPAASSSNSVNELHQHNRAGLNLCHAFNNGSCVSSSKGNAVCPRDSTRRHQCSYCLQVGHGRHNCNANQPAGFKQGPPNKRSRKGKGGGKKGKSRGENQE